MSIRKLAGETAIYGISSIVGRLLYFLLTPYYTHLFAPAEYGIVTDLFAYIGFAMVLFTYRMELAYFRFATESEAGKKTVFDTALTSIVGSTVLLGLIFLLLSPWMAAVSGYPDKANMVGIAVGILCLDALAEIPFARLRLERRPVKFAAIRLGSILVNLGANIFFLSFCPYALAQESWKFLHSFLNAIYTPEFGIGYIFLSNLIASGFTLLLLAPQFFKLRLSIDPALWRKMTDYALPLVVVGFSYVINEMFDRKVMTRLLPGSTEENLHQLGIYGANYKLAMLLSLFTQAFRYGAEPFFFRERGKEGSTKAYADVAKFFAIAGILGFLGVTLFIDIFKYFIAPDYWSGLGAVPVLLIANLFLGLYYNFSIWYKLTDRTRWGAYISVAGALITIILNLWLVPVWGYMGAAWATLICYATMMLASFFIGKKYLDVPYQSRRMLLYFGFALICFGLSSYFKDVFGFGFWTALAANSFLLLCFLLLVFWLEKGAFLKKKRL